MSTDQTKTPGLIRVKTSDGQEFQLAAEEASQSRTIKNMMEDTGADCLIPLPNITGRILSQVIVYFKKHAASAASDDDDLKAWDAEFVKVDQATLFDLILAANYLDIASLLDLACQTVADMIKGKSPEEIRTLFNIKNDFTPEEEEEVRRENQWAFE
ncbi:hypothetical protein TIFTF001_007431 [Ficus carica]|uniref:SKP1-like protein n=1 Tax=Ficus carica TaxID=3494 RepID=A0AA87ZQ33_FICCA|nr:hypothetical protein TIFTF001_007431 [Ficus carica]